MAALTAIIAAPDGFAGTFEPVLEWLLCDTGLSLLNPACGAITTLDLGCDEQVPTTLEALKLSLAGGRGNVQLWFGVGDGIFVAWDRNKISVHLDGFGVEQTRPILRSIVENFATAVDWGPEIKWRLEIEFV